MLAAALPFSAVAVPKRKQTHSRTAKRRSQHKPQAPRLAPCPGCGRLRLPHRVCPHCGTYRGREVVGSSEDEAQEGQGDHR